MQCKHEWEMTGIIYKKNGAEKNNVYTCKFCKKKEIHVKA